MFKAGRVSFPVGDEEKMSVLVPAQPLLGSGWIDYVRQMAARVVPVALCFTHRPDLAQAAAGRIPFDCPASSGRIDALDEAVVLIEDTLGGVTERVSHRNEMPGIVVSELRGAAGRAHRHQQTARDVIE